MNLVKNLFKHKVITVSSVVILFFTFCVLAVYWFEPSWAHKLDLEAFRKGKSAECERRLCISEWINKYQSEANLTQMKELCSGYVWSSFINTTFRLYEEEKVDWKFLHDIYQYAWYQYCHRNCGLKGVFDFFRYYHAYYQQLAEAWKQHEMCYGRFQTEESCRWRAYSIIFPTYFSYISIPLTIILNYFNLSILWQLLGENAGPAFYFHTAEIITDALLNIIVGLTRGMFLTIAIDNWRGSCGLSRYISVYQCVAVAQRFVSFLNQAYLISLLADRLFALAKPIEYRSMSTIAVKKRAKNMILNILLGSFTFYLPLFFFRTYRNVFFYWGTVSDFWKANYNRIDMTISSLYVIVGFALVILQVIYGIIVKRKYSKFVEKQMEMSKKKVINKSEAELKKKERDKQLLLAGTIGLNVITSIISAIFSAVLTKSFFALLGYTNHRPWWSMLLFMIDPVLSFVNGTGAVVIHVICVKSYRQAFKATPFGKLIFRHQG